MQDHVGASGPSRSVAVRPGRRSLGDGRFVPWVLAVGALDFGLEQFMVVPVLPAVQQELGVTLSAATWSARGVFETR